MRAIISSRNSSYSSRVTLLASSIRCTPACASRVPHSQSPNAGSPSPGRWFPHFGGKRTADWDRTAEGRADSGTSGPPRARARGVAEIIVEPSSRTACPNETRKRTGSLIVPLVFSLVFARARAIFAHRRILPCSAAARGPSLSWVVAPCRRDRAGAASISGVDGRNWAPAGPVRLSHDEAESQVRVLARALLRRDRIPPWCGAAMLPAGRRGVIKSFAGGHFSCAAVRPSEHDPVVGCPPERSSRLRRAPRDHETTASRLRGAPRVRVGESNPGREPRR